MLITAYVADLAKASDAPIAANRPETQDAGLSFAARPLDIVVLAERARGDVSIRACENGHTGKFSKIDI